MGYNTKYKLTVITPEIFGEITNEIRKADGGYDPLDSGEVKWYDWREQCEKISAMYVNAEFYIDGQGQEADDQWRCFFKAGRSSIYRKSPWVPPETLLLNEDRWSTAAERCERAK